MYSVYAGMSVRCGVCIVYYVMYVLCVRYDVCIVCLMWYVYCMYGVGVFRFIQYWL